MMNAVIDKTTGIKIDLSEFGELLKDIEKKMVRVGCPYCNIDNYERAAISTEGYDREYLVERGFLNELLMLYNTQTKQFGIGAEGEGGVCTEINFCPKCGRDLR